ncbi:MAG: beta-ketoacyl synthase chain length factor [Bacteroidetes bacterium]|nr:beta-ketoacyl synthase chain length factor [Bacteroidota bacterium]HET6244620.1 beta-ketoacyl synthase chain length factor [Bacteroidia bacterium]
MEAFIRGTGIISPQNTFNTANFLLNPVETESNFLHCIEPSYLEFLNPVMARRMGRIIKMGIAAASICLKDAKLEMPDAIITGTALGCLGDTEKFLTAIIEDDELFLTPTSFIQSIQNTVSAQIALQLKCMNYNFTYVHKGFSFESAVLDAMMLIAEGNANNVLIGGLDEMTEKNFLVYDRINLWKKEKIKSSELIHSKTIGTIAGEGAAFFVLSNQENENNYAKLKGVKTIYKPNSQQDIEKEISFMLADNNLNIKSIDLVIYGINGDNNLDSISNFLKDNYLKNSAAAYFKHLCGEYQTSGSFAMWMAAKILKTQTIPEHILIGTYELDSINNILIYNNFGHENHVLYLFSRV